MEGENSGKKPVLPDQRLQSPLKPDIGRLAYNYWTNGQESEKTPVWIQRTVNQMAKHYQHLLVRVNDGHWNDVSYQLYNFALSAEISTTNLRLFERLQNISWTTTATFYAGIQKELWLNPPNQIWPTTIALFEARQQAHKLKNLMMQTSRGRDIVVHHAKCLNCEFLISRQLCLINIDGLGSWFIDYDAILCLNDVLDQRYLASFALQLYSLMYPDVYTVNENDFRNLLKWGDMHLSKSMNQAFKVIKMFESICMSEMLRKSHPINVSTKFSEQRLEDYVAAGGDLTLLQDLMTVLEKHKIPMLSELFGLFRIWGHPVVDEINGCRKVQEIGKAPVTPNPTILKKIRACFIREFCMNFIRQEGRWPNLIVLDPNSRVARLYARQQTNWIQSKDQMDLMEWEPVVLCQNFDFDYCKDFTQLIDDKSISTYLDHWDSVYDSDLLGYVPPAAIESRRVILEILRRSDIDIEEILTRIMTRDIPREWFVIGLHSKERELKIDPRLFVMLVLEVRMYFCVTELNLAEKIFKYFPQQTMTSSESDLVTRLLKVTDKYGSKRDVIPVVINIDFEKWNLRWRESTTNDIFRVIDNLFGTPGLYTFSHEFFKKSMFYLVSRYRPPTVSKETRLNPDEQETVWFNDESGKEGIRQKGWTLITIAALLYVEAETNIPSVITGQGDNQVIIASFPVPDGVSKEDHLNNSTLGLQASIENYMNVLINTFDQIGMPIKREESWTSLGLFAYGKDIIWDGAIMPMCIKRCTRIAPDVNDTFPTLANNLSTIFSSGQAACVKGFDIYIPYFLALMESGRYIINSLNYHVLSHGPLFTSSISNVLRRDDNLLQLVLTLPHALGGYPVMSPIDYIARGHSDPVTTGILALKYLAKVFPCLARILTFLIETEPFSKRIDYKFIIADPTAINWDVPQPPTVLIKRIIQDEFETICSNQQINKLFHDKSLQEEESLIKILSGIRPFSPRIFNEIYRNSPCGAREGILATVSHVRTLRNMAQRSGTYDLFGRLSSYEQSFISHILSWYDRSREHIAKPAGCTRVLADRWRSRSWFPHEYVYIEGVTMPHPLEQFEICRQQDPSEPPGNAIVYIIEPSQGVHRCLEMGKNCAFVGSLTKERKMSRLLNQAVNDPPLKAALRLQTISDYVVKPNSMLSTIMDNIMQSRTNIPLHYLRCSADRVIAGSRTHRLEDVTAKRGGLLNVRPNFSSHVYHSTDLMGKYAFGFENHNINYLLVIACNMVQLQYWEGSHSQHRIIYVSRLACTECTQSIEEELLDVAGDHESLLLKSYSDCYLVYSHYNQLSMERVMTGGSYVHTVAVNRVEKKDLKSAVSYMLALQVILRADRATIGNVYGTTAHSTRYQSVILGIGEIALLGFKELVLAIAHLNTILFLIKYFNRIILTRGVDVLGIIHASRETLNLELYAELIQAFTLPAIQAEILNIIPGMAFPTSIMASRTGAIAVIQTIIDQCLADRIKSIETLPPLQCSSFPEWYVVAELNVMHRVLRSAFLINEFNDEYFGRVCVALKTLHQLESDATGTDLINLLMDGVHKSLFNSFNTQSASDLIRISEHMDQVNFRTVPLLHTEEGVEKWIAALKQYYFLTQQQHQQQASASRPPNVPPPCQKLQPYILTDFSCECQITSKMMIVPIDTPYTVPEKRRHDHIWRLDGVATASYKLLQIIRWFNIDPLIAICLGEGEGSIAAMLYKIFNTGVLFYNSLLDSQNFPPHRYIHHMPTELSVIPTGVLYQYGLTLYGPNDITTVDCQQLLTTKLPKDIWSLITCDAEISRLGHTEAFKLLRGVLLIALPLLAPSGYLIFKTYLGIDTAVAQQIGALTAAFANVWMTCPHFSSYESTEVYMVCYNKRVAVLEDVASILHDGYYPTSGVDLNHLIQRVQRLKRTRVSSHLPLQFLAERRSLSLLKYIRKYYNRPIWRNSLNILVGSRFSGPFTRLEPWLKRRTVELQASFNVLLASLFEQTHIGIDWERLSSVLTRGHDTGIQMYTYIRQLLHASLLLLTIYLKMADVPVRQILQILEVEMSKVREHRLEDGTLLCSFNLRLSEPAWRKRYARHFFHMVGEICLMNTDH